MKNILNLLCNGKVKDFHGTLDPQKKSIMFAVQWEVSFFL